MLREVVERIRTLIEIQGENNCSFIYPALLVAKIAPEMIE
jgi:L-cystine uptake protein TcyP (sodium:dicarboxylate symporter family)